MLNFTKYNSKLPPSTGALAPDQFAKYCQQISFSETVRVLNDNSKLSGLVACQVGNGIQLKVADVEAFRRHHRLMGHPPEVAERLLNHLSETLGEPQVENIEVILDAIKKLCAQLPECRPMLTSVPIVIGAEPFLNAGASPVPHGGDFIMLNQGLFSSSVWVTGLEHVFWPDAFGISGEQKVKIILDLSPLALSIMGNPQAQLGNPAPMEALIRIGGLVPDKFTLTLDEVFPILFVLLHEMGHIKLGHTEEMRSWPPLSEASQEIKEQILARCRQCEFEADAFAARQTLRLETQGKQAEKGIAFFFTLLNTYERQVVARPTELRTHPPAADRFHEAMKVVCSEEDLMSWTPLFEGINHMLSLRVRPSPDEAS